MKTRFVEPLIVLWCLLVGPLGAYEAKQFLESRQKLACSVCHRPISTFSADMCLDCKDAMTSRIQEDAEADLLWTIEVQLDSKSLVGPSRSNAFTGKSVSNPIKSTSAPEKTCPRRCCPDSLEPSESPP